MNLTQETLNLTQQPESVTRPSIHYVFIEKIGPFQNTAPQAWQELHRLVPGIAEHNQITGYLSLFKVGPKIYRAGVSLANVPKQLPEGVQSEEVQGGEYSRFVLKGPYSQLPAAYGRVFEIISEKNLPVRDDYFVENYVNDPRSTAEAELVTEILVPTA
jgi:effector-binding domain-containing protein